MKKFIGLMVLLCLLGLSASCVKVLPAGEDEEPSETASHEGEVPSEDTAPTQAPSGIESPPAASALPVEPQPPQPTPGGRSSPPESGPAAEKARWLCAS